MTRPFQTDATIARQQNDALFEDTLDCCTEKPAPAPIGELLNGIAPQQSGSEKLLDDARAILQMVGEIKQSADKCLSRFDAIVKKKALKGSTGWLRAGVEWRYSNRRYWDDEYQTLALKGRGSFIEWSQIGADGKPKPKRLYGFRFYPVLITENMRMVFVRATKKHLTYMRDKMRIGTTKLVGKTPFKTSVYFPKENTKTRNIIITLERVPGSETCSLEFLFDGEQFHLVNIFSTAPFYDKGFDALVKAELINRPEVLDVFLRYCFMPLHCGELDIDKKNLEEYLRDGRYKVGLTEAAQTPFLILKKDERPW